ncbi:MAG TPA: hypothetical protein VIG99_18625 [Myxococcaceae bacterium]|jgi:hypothetical protein
MNGREFEEFIRTAWTTTHAPLTNENLQRMSGLPRSDVEHLMRGLMRKGVVDMDVTASGAIAWCVRGVARAPEPAPASAPAPTSGPATLAPADPPRAAALAVPPRPPPAPPISGEVAPSPGKSYSVTVPGTGWRVGFTPDPERKSILLSGGASLLFGPFGWMYAGAWKEVVPAIAIYAGVVFLFPKFLIAALLGVLHPACGVVGMVYAYRHNRARARTPLLLVDRPPTVTAIASAPPATLPGEGPGQQDGPGNQRARGE